MSKLPIVSGNEVIKVLIKLGFQHVRTTGNQRELCLVYCISQDLQKRSLRKCLSSKFVKLLIFSKLIKSSSLNKSLSFISFLDQNIC